MKTKQIYLILKILMFTTLTIAAILMIHQNNFLIQDQASEISQQKKAIAKLESEAAKLNLETAKQQKAIANARQLLTLAFGQEPNEMFEFESIKVTVSAYSASIDETNNEPWVTSSGEASRSGQAALSPDLRKNFPFLYGSSFILNGKSFGNKLLGFFPGMDTMSSHKRKNTSRPVKIANSVDILHTSKKAAKKFGVKEALLIYPVPKKSGESSNYLAKK